MAEDIKEKQKRINATKRNSQYKTMVTLKISEGEILKKIISDNGCDNLSQLCKKIVKSELTLY